MAIPRCPDCNAKIPKSERKKKKPVCSECGADLRDELDEPATAGIPRELLIAFGACGLLLVAGMIVMVVALTRGRDEDPVGPEPRSIVQVDPAPQPPVVLPQPPAAEPPKKTPPSKNKGKGQPKSKRPAIDPMLRPRGPVPDAAAELKHALLELGQAPRTQVVLNWEKPLISMTKGLLAHELQRQALLLAARDELGLPTRDQALDETADPNLPHFTVRTSYLENCVVQEIEFEIPASKKDARGLYVNDLDTLWRPPNGLDYEKAVEVFEQQSRGRLTKMLKDLGYQGQPRRTLDKGELPKAVVDLVGQLNFVSQYAALRQIQQLIREQGESPQTLAALARVYAHLGLLTEHQWNHASKIYKARGWLYAQRLLARKKDAWSLWHRAYVTALIGRHASSLADLGEAEKLGDNGVRPSWVPVIAAHCRMDPDRMRAATEPVDEELQLLLSFNMVRDLQAVNRTQLAGQDTIKKMPECYVVHDDLCGLGGVRNLHLMTTMGYDLFKERTLPHLLELPGLPAAARQQQADEVNMVRSLLASSKEGNDEPSWAMLGQLAREQRYVQVWRRLEFMRDVWSVPVAEFYEEAYPLVVDHPYAPFIRSFAIDRARAAAEYKKLVTAVPDDAPSMARIRYYDDLRLVDPKRSDELGMDAYSDYADVTSEIVRMVPRLNKAVRSYWGKTLARISPHSPVARALLIDGDWDNARDKIEGWERESSWSTHFLWALAVRAESDQRWEDALRLLGKVQQLSPDYTTYARQAGIYKELKQDEKWRETLEAYLKQPDFGLQHAQVRVEISDYFMTKGDYKQAEPYAAQAAETFAAWAMLNAVRCYDGQKNFAKAEQWIKNASERYPQLACEWFYWCHCNGRGDFAASGKVAGAYIDSVVRAGTGDDLIKITCCVLLIGDNMDALRFLKSINEVDHDSNALIFAALVAESFKELPTRDTHLKKAGNLQFKEARLAQLFEQSLGNKQPLDLKAADEFLNGLDANRRGACEFFVGHFLLVHGRAKEAGPYLRRALQDHHCFRGFRALAALDLRQVAKAR